MTEKVALVTGASSGIGYDIAECLAKRGYHVLVAGQNAGRLEAAVRRLEASTKAKFSPLLADLSLPDGAKRLYEQVETLKLQPEVLVNNAGFGMYGKFTETSLEEEMRMIQVNVSALVTLTKWFSRQMLAGKKGYILNVASTAAFQPGPLMSVYYASKAFVLHFSEALNEEFRRTGVSVTALCPGPTETNFAATAKTGKTRIFKMNVMDSRSVAIAGVNAMFARRPFVVPGVVNWTTAFSVRFIPRSWVSYFSKKAVEEV